MTYTIKIFERKNDGWFYDDSIAELGSGIYEYDLVLWNRALMNLFHNSDLYAKWEKCADNYERKKVLWEAMQLVLDFQLEDLKTDLETNIKIYPLIKKKMEE